MQRKELLYVALGALLLTNISIIGTLFFTGVIGGGGAPEPNVEEIDDEQSTSPTVVAGEEVEPESRVNYLHTLAEAMYICEDRLTSSNSHLLKSFSIDYQTSRYIEETDIFFVFIEMETVGLAGKPGEIGDIYCEVSPASRSIVNYQQVMREE